MRDSASIFLDAALHAHANRHTLPAHSLAPGAPAHASPPALPALAQPPRCGHSWMRWPMPTSTCRCAALCMAGGLMPRGSSTDPLAPTLYSTLACLPGPAAVDGHGRDPLRGGRRAPPPQPPRRAGPPHVPVRGQRCMLHDERAQLCAASAACCATLAPCCAAAPPPGGAALVPACSALVLPACPATNGRIKPLNLSRQCSNADCSAPATNAGLWNG